MNIWELISRLKSLKSSLFEDVISYYSMNFGRNFSLPLRLPAFQGSMSVKQEKIRIILTAQYSVRRY